MRGADAPVGCRGDAFGAAGRPGHRGVCVLMGCRAGIVPVQRAVTQPLSPGRGQAAQSAREHMAVVSYFPLRFCRPCCVPRKSHRVGCQETRVWATSATDPPGWAGHHAPPHCRVSTRDDESVATRRACRAAPHVVPFPAPSCSAEGGQALVFEVRRGAPRSPSPSWRPSWRPSCRKA